MARNELKMLKDELSTNQDLLKAYIGSLEKMKITHQNEMVDSKNKEIYWESESDKYESFYIETLNKLESNDYELENKKNECDQGLLRIDEMEKIINPLKDLVRVLLR